MVIDAVTTLASLVRAGPSPAVVFNAGHPYSFRPPGWPDGIPLTVAALADFHFGGA